MKITPSLDIDNDIDNLVSGTLAMAGDVVVNNTNNAIMSENAIDQIIQLQEGETIVGKIACSDEFIIFISTNRILRYNERTNSQIFVETNWQWQGGEVIGTYTYNANQELVIAISERIDYENEKVPLKVINLDKPNYLAGANDIKYTLAPNIPHFNLIGYEFTSGDFIDKGVYNFFIRFKLGDDYTSWFRLGYPVNIYNTSNKVVIEKLYYAYELNTNGRNSEVVDSFEYSVQCDDEANNISKNINLQVQIDIQDVKYDHYQIGYIVSTIDNNTKVYTTNDYEIDNNHVIINCINNVEVSADEMTRDAFNIYNAKTLCNYNNRIYLANYNEENLNAEIEDIDVSGITVKATSYAANGIATTSLTNESNTFPRTVQTRATQVNTPDSFDVGHNYYVEMYFNFKDGNENIPLNLKLFANRIGVDSSTGDKYLVIKTSDIMHAVTAASGRRSYNSVFSFDVNYNHSLIRNAHCIAISKKSLGYNIRFPINNSFNYSTLWSDTININTFATDVTNATEAAKPRYGFEKDVVTTTNNQKANVVYNVPLDNVMTGDIYVTNIVQFDSVIECLNTIEDGWFYNGKFTIDGEEYRTVGTYTGNNFAQNPTSFTIKVDGETNKYIARKATDYNIIFDENAIYNKLITKYPNCAFKVQEYTETENGNEGTNGSYIDVKPATEEENFITLLYDNVRNKIYFGLVNYNSPFMNNIINFTPCTTKLTVVENGGSSQEIELNEALNTPTYTKDRENATLNDLINYYENGGDVGYTTTYQWREDTQPSVDDFQPTESYSFIAGKKVVESFNGNTAVTGDLDTEIRMFAYVPQAVGFRNIVEDEETHTVTVDKDYCIVVSLRDMLRYDENINNYTDNDLFIVKETQDDEDGFTGYLGRFYVLFRTEDVVNYNGNNVINGHLCYIRDDLSLSSPIPVFDEIMDMNQTIDSYSYPCLRELDRTTPIFTIPLFYISYHTTGPLSDLDDQTFESEYTKSAINHAVYNFFIHFVYANGNYTAGIKIPNNLTYSLNLPVIKSIGGDTVNGLSVQCDENTTVNDIKVLTQIHIDSIPSGGTVVYDTDYNVHTLFDVADDVRICNIYPVYNSNNIALYINDKGEKLFRGTDGEHNTFKSQNAIIPIKFEFENIPVISKFVGYFISYEKPEHIMIGRGPLIGYSNNDPTHITDDDNRFNDFNTIKSLKYAAARFYYPEFNITKQAGGANMMFIESNLLGGDASITEMFKDFHQVVAKENLFDTSDKYYFGGIKKNTIFVPNDDGNNNGGREGVLGIEFNEKVLIDTAYVENGNQDKLYYTIGICLTLNGSIYLNENKELISLGYTKYYDDEYMPNTYGKEEFPYDYDYYYNNDISLIAFNGYGVVYDETTAIPTYYDDEGATNNNEEDGDNLLYPNYPTIKKDYSGRPGTSGEDWRVGHTSIFRFLYNSYNDFDIKAIQIDNAPIEHYYTLYKDLDEAENADNNDIRNVRTVYIYPQYVNDLFKISSIYKNYTSKLIINYNKDNYSNFITYYGKTIRRSAVVSDE